MSTKKIKQRFAWYQRKKNAKKSYSQDGEDMVLFSFVSDLQIKNGFYVDVGAHHPYRFSNTAFFYNIGWRGINIEAAPTAIDNFKKFRKEDINLNIGISGKKSNLTFYVFDEPAINSFDKELSEDRDKNTIYNIIDRVTVETYSLAEVLEQYVPSGRKIDFLTIDVEGLDFEVLNSNNWDKFKPMFLLVEQDFNVKTIQNDAIYKLLSNLNYELVARTQRTSIYKLIE